MKPIQIGQESVYQQARLATGSAPGSNPGADAVAKVVKEPVRPKASVVDESRDLQVAAEKAAEQIQNFVSSMSRSVRLYRDDASSHIVVQLVNPETGELIRTLPSQELLKIARSFEILGSVMVNRKA